MKLSSNRYENIKHIVIRLFKKYDIRKIPIDGFEICQKMGIILIPYSSLPTEQALQVAMSISKDGFFTEIVSNQTGIPISSNCIFYNDRMPVERIRFTIMHEIGHFVLDHTQHSELAESEANFFARYALAPPPLVHQEPPEDFMDIADRFNLSQECAYYAMKSYMNWLRYAGRNYADYEIELLYLFGLAG